MGTRMVSAAESPVHDNWKQAIVDAAETDTLFLNQRHSPALRALRTERTEALAFAEHNVFGDFGNPQQLYFGGDMEAAIALGGQVVGRIDEVRPVADIIADTVREFGETVDRLAGRGLPSEPRLSRSARRVRHVAALRRVEDDGRHHGDQRERRDVEPRSSAEVAIDDVRQGVDRVEAQSRRSAPRPPAAASTPRRSRRHRCRSASSRRRGGSAGCTARTRRACRRTTSARGTPTGRSPARTRRTRRAPAGPVVRRRSRRSSMLFPSLGRACQSAISYDADDRHVATSTACGSLRSRYHRRTQFGEVAESGRTCLPAKEVTTQVVRGFKSHPLR